MVEELPHLRCLLLLLLLLLLTPSLGFTAFYLAVYCVHYFIAKLDIVGSASTFLYFGYTSVMVFCFFLLTGICDTWIPVSNRNWF